MYYENANCRAINEAERSDGIVHCNYKMFRLI